MEVCFTCGGGVLFLDSKVLLLFVGQKRVFFIKQSRLNRTFEQEKEIIG